MPPFEREPGEAPLGQPQLYDPFKWRIGLSAEEAVAARHRDQQRPPRHVRRLRPAHMPDPPHAAPLSRPSAHLCHAHRRAACAGSASSAPVGEKIEGSVPLLKGVVSAYAGDPMVPFIHHHLALLDNHVPAAGRECGCWSV